MQYIRNSSQYLYYNLEDYLSALDEKATGDTLQMLFIYTLPDLFVKIKKRAALRGKLAKDGNGQQLLDDYAITDDEEDSFLDWLRLESTRIFKRISGYSKNIPGAFRFNVNFGDPLQGGVISEVSVDGLTLTDVSADMEANEFAGMKFVIAEAGLLMNQERTIVSNTATGVVLSSAFASDVTGMEYAISAQTDKHILIYTTLSVERFDTNMLEGIDALFEKAFIGAVLKEWYLINRFMDDWRIESETLGESIADLRSSFFQMLSTKRTFNEIF